MIKQFVYSDTELMQMREAIEELKDLVSEEKYKGEDSVARKMFLLEFLEKKTNTE